ncbi:MAG: arginine deiminase family protein [Pseudorhizobium sp.]
MQPFPSCWGHPLQHYGPAAVEGGDVMPIGTGTVLIGMGECTTPQGGGQIPRNLFAGGGATRDCLLVSSGPGFDALM